MTTLISLLLLYFNVQIAITITQHEMKGDKIMFKIIIFIMCFFMWPMLLIDKYIYKK
jgi:hypothetical protein